MSETFTAQDRCDSCSAQAFVRWAMVDQPLVLDFCAHHSNKHAAALEAAGWVIALDDRVKINKKASASSA